MTQTDALAHATTRRRVFAVLAAAVALLILAAIIGQLVYSLSFDPEKRAFFFTNFFSFFTILSNVLAVIALIKAAWFSSTRAADPTWFTAFFGAVATYMATTGIVYNTLLRQISLDQEATLGWSNEVLHLIGPILVVAAWIFAPGRGALTFRHLRVAAIFPIVWVIYTLIRGAAIGWYPYPFLNPERIGGYGIVAIYVVAIAVVILGFDAIVVWVSRKLRPRT